MFESVVRELRKQGAIISDALRIANEIDLTQCQGLSARAIAVQAWNEEMEAYQQHLDELEYEEQMEILYSN